MTFWAMTRVFSGYIPTNFFPSYDLPPLLLFPVLGTLVHSFSNAKFVKKNKIFKMFVMSSLSLGFEFKVNQTGYR
jgi:hypothetical protein